MQYIVKVNYAGSEEWKIMHNGQDELKACAAFGQIVNQNITKFGSPDNKENIWRRRDPNDQDAHTVCYWTNKCTVKIDFLQWTFHSTESFGKIDATIRHIARTHFAYKDMPICYRKIRGIKEILEIFYRIEVPERYVADVLKTMK